LNKKRYANPSGMYDSELFSHASEFKSEDKVSFDDEAGMRNLRKVAMKMLADCPAIILEMEEDRLMKMSLVKSKRETLLLKGSYRDQNSAPFLANKKDKKRKNFHVSIIGLF
jgi:hypothetical protein